MSNCIGIKELCSDWKCLRDNPDKHKPIEKLKDIEIFHVCDEDCDKDTFKHKVKLFHNNKISEDIRKKLDEKGTYYDKENNILYVTDKVDLKQEEPSLKTFVKAHPLFSTLFALGGAVALLFAFRQANGLIPKNYSNKMQSVIKPVFKNINGSANNLGKKLFEKTTKVFTKVKDKVLHKIVGYFPSLKTTVATAPKTVEKVVKAAVPATKTSETVTKTLVSVPKAVETVAKAVAPAPKTVETLVKAVASAPKTSEKVASVLTKTPVLGLIR